MMADKPHSRIQTILQNANKIIKERGLQKQQHQQNVNSSQKEKENAYDQQAVQLRHSERPRRICRKLFDAVISLYFCTVNVTYLRKGHVVYQIYKVKSVYCSSGTIIVGHENKVFLCSSVTIFQTL